MKKLLSDLATVITVINGIYDAIVFIATVLTDILLNR